MASSISLSFVFASRYFTLAAAIRSFASYSARDGGRLARSVAGFELANGECCNYAGPRLPADAAGGGLLGLTFLQHLVLGERFPPDDFEAIPRRGRLAIEPP